MASEEPFRGIFTDFDRKDEAVQSSAAIADWWRYRDDPARAGQRIGFVPTMGALHAGHRSLIEAARRESEVVVASIFVNPTQFGPREDFSKYPRTLEADLEICAAAGADFVWHPSVEEMYPPRFSTWVNVEGISAQWEGSHRPTHFRGVTTVVLKLLNLVRPHLACFGQKDFQQQALIRRMCQDLDLGVEIRTCPTIREPDGLALSSRNRYLSPAERQAAVVLSQSLQFAATSIARGAVDLPQIEAQMWQRLVSTPLVEPDYAAIVDPETLERVTTPLATCVALVAAKVGSTRLIDNWIIEIPPAARTAHRF